MHISIPYRSKPPFVLISLDHYVVELTLTPRTYHLIYHNLLKDHMPYWIYLSMLFLHILEDIIPEDKNKRFTFLPIDHTVEIL